MTEQEELELLRQFFLDICRCVFHHAEENHSAVVYVNTLEKALVKVDRKWWEKATT